jgi:hypothetical protein
MNADMIARTIQMILAPVVMISACALVLTGLWGHYTNINEKLRAMMRERLDLLRGLNERSGRSTELDPVSAERVQEIGVEAPQLLRRHKRIMEAVLAIYGSIAVFVASMFAIAISTAFSSVVVANVALLLFLAGTAVLLAGVLLIASEVRISHRTIDYEVDRVLSVRVVMGSGSMEKAGVNESVRNA